MKNFSMFLLGVFSHLVSLSGDTLFVKTERGTFLVDSKTGLFVPTDEHPHQFAFSCDDSFFTEHPDFSLEYSFETRQLQNGTFDWWKLEKISGGTREEILNFDTKPPSSGYILYPLFVSLSGDSLYFASVNGDAQGNEQGIFYYDVRHKKFEKILAPGEYKRQPVVNQSRTHIFFVRPSNGVDELVSLHLSSRQKEVILRNASISMLGIHIPSFHPSYVSSCNVDEDQPELRSPCMPEVDFCITRMGLDAVLSCDEACVSTGNLCSPAPFCEGHCELMCTDCRDAVDLDVLPGWNPANDVMVASHGGFVIRAQTLCPQQGMGQGYGFGYHVVIRHGPEQDGNAPETLYAHLSEVFVEEGEYVWEGQPIGVIGNSQVLDCTGDGILDCECESDSQTHLHYEYHDGSGTLYSVNDIRMPIWVDIGVCVPQPNQSYEAGWQHFESDATYPSINYQVFLDVDCGGDSYATVVGVSCPCCESEWILEGAGVPGDTIVVPLVEFLANNNNVIWLSRIVDSPCISTGGYGEVALNLNVIFALCVYGCTNPEACNFNEDATGDDGSCDFSCLSICDLADLNSDQIVNVMDCTTLFQYFGTSGIPPIPGDVTNDGVVNLTDLLTLFQYFGQVCP